MKLMQMGGSKKVALVAFFFFFFFFFFFLLIYACSAGSRSRSQVCILYWCAVEWRKHPDNGWNHSRLEGWATAWRVSDCSPARTGAAAAGQWRAGIADPVGNTRYH